MKKLHLLILMIMINLVFTSVLVGSTNPLTDGPIIVLLFLANLFLLIFFTSYLIQQLLSRKFSLSRAARYYSSLTISSGVVFIFGLQTIAQLQVADLILVVCFEFLANFYIFRRL